MDSGPDESDLEAADRGDGGAMGVPAELESDEPRAPGGVVPLEVAGDAEQLLGARGDRAASAGIVRVEPLETTGAVQPPDLADRAVGDGQVGGDSGQGDALLMTADDLLAERDRERAWHGSRLREPATGDHRLTEAHVTYTYE
jgi:hypothetical protein